MPLKENKQMVKTMKVCYRSAVTCCWTSKFLIINTNKYSPTKKMSLKKKNV